MRSDVQPLAEAEFLAVDTETNGLAGDSCEVTEVGFVLVGGGELHDRFASLVRANRPPGRRVERLTGITGTMLAQAPEPETVLPHLARELEGRVFVAHNASFDRRVLAQAFRRAGLQWPDPPTLCTLALARRFAPLARRRGLAALAGTLGIEVDVQHRALPDAETCARVFCALLPKLVTHAPTVADALALAGPGAGRPRRERRRAAPAPGAPALVPGLTDLPNDPGVYVFRDTAGRPLYVGKSIAVRTRARSHFAPSSVSGDWTAHAAGVEYRATASELGALVLENRLIKELRPPGNRRLRDTDGLVFLRCRLDIPFPILEVAPEPASGHGVTIGPLRSRAAAIELVEQLNSLFQLRHCGRGLKLRPHASAYGQMGRCLSPCLGDLDPNLYRRRLDEALALFTGPSDGRSRLLAHVEEQLERASREQRYERAAWLLRRHGRLERVLRRLGGVLRATHAAPRLVLARHPHRKRFDALWIVGGRVVDWGPLPTLRELQSRTSAALVATPAPGAAYVPAEEVDEVRIVAGWLEEHPETPTLPLNDPPDADALEELIALARAA